MTAGGSGEGPGGAEAANGGGGAAGGYGGLVESIGNTVNSGIEEFDDNEKERIELAGNDPCYLAEQLRSNYVMFVMPTLKKINSAALMISGEGRKSVRRAIAKWGRSDSRYLSAIPFARYLINTNVAPMPAGAVFLSLLGGPAGPAGAAAMWQEFLNSRLPPTPDALKGTKSGSNKGYALPNSDGVYFYKPGAAAGSGQHTTYGRLRGDGVVAAYNLWRARMKEDVVPPAHNRWRARLTRLAGDYRQDGTVWREGDPYVEGSIGHSLEEFKEWSLVDLEWARGLCIDAGGTPSDDDAPQDDGSSSSSTTNLGLLLVLVLLARSRR